MRLGMRGTSTSGVEVREIAPTGLWLNVLGTERFLPYSRYPWFAGAGAAAIRDVRLLHGRNLRWPKLDVDLSLESLSHPERFPLKARSRPLRRSGRS